jgi:hypothetical protein
MNSEGQNSETVLPATEPMISVEDDCVMTSDDLSQIRLVLADFQQVVVQLKSPCAFLAKAACETSREAWLTFFPFRRQLLAEHREIVLEFRAGLFEATRLLTTYVATNPDRLDQREMSDLNHYLNNTRERIELVDAMLEGEKAIRRLLSERTRQFAGTR